MFNQTTRRIARLKEKLKEDYPNSDLRTLVETMQTAGFGLEEMTAMFRQDATYLAMMENGNDQSKAARWLGVHRNTLSRNLEGWIERMERIF